MWCVARLVPSVQFKKREKHPWKSVNFSKVAQAQACNFIKINTPPRVISTFFKLYKWYQIVQRTTYRDVFRTHPNICNGDLLRK